MPSQARELARQVDRRAAPQLAERVVPEHARPRGRSTRAERLAEARVVLVVHPAAGEPTPCAQTGASRRGRQRRGLPSGPSGRVCTSPKLGAVSVTNTAGARPPCRDALAAAQAGGDQVVGVARGEGGQTASRRFPHALRRITSGSSVDHTRARPSPSHISTWPPQTHGPGAVADERSRASPRKVRSAGARRHPPSSPGARIGDPACAVTPPFSASARRPAVSRRRPPQPRAATRPPARPRAPGRSPAAPGAAHMNVNEVVSIGSPRQPLRRWRSTALRLLVAASGLQRDSLRPPGTIRRRLRVRKRPTLQASDTARGGQHSSCCRCSKGQLNRDAVAVITVRNEQPWNPLVAEMGRSERVTVAVPSAALGFSPSTYVSTHGELLSWPACRRMWTVEFSALFMKSMPSTPPGAGAGVVRELAYTEVSIWSVADQPACTWMPSRNLPSGGAAVEILRLG